MFELSFQQQEAVSGGGKAEVIIKVAEVVIVVGEVAKAAYDYVNSSNAAEKAAQEKAAQAAAAAEAKRIQEEAARREQERLDDEWYERRLQELQNKRSEEFYSDFDSYAGGPEVDIDFGDFWGGGGGGGREVAEDSYSSWA